MPVSPLLPAPPEDGMRPSLHLASEPVHMGWSPGLILARCAVVCVSVQELCRWQRDPVPSFFSNSSRDSCRFLLSTWSTSSTTYYVDGAIRRSCVGFYAHTWMNNGGL